MTDTIPAKPLDIACAKCEAQAREKCTTVLGKGGRYVRVLDYFHAERWRELDSIRRKYAALDDWQKTYNPNEYFGA